MENKGQGSMNNLDLSHLIRVCEARIKVPSSVIACLLLAPERAFATAYEHEFTPPTVLSLLHRLQAAEKRVKLYDELLYAVGSKYPNETRHETALRYIHEREQPKDIHACKEAE